MKTPSIKIEYNFQKEVKQFLRSLNHPNLPWLKNLVFNNFPELKKEIENKKTKNHRKTIEKFISLFKNKHRKKINKIILKSKKDLKGAKLVLSKLSFLMDYKWPSKHPGYIIIPTILPYSPFEKNLYYFSILGQIYGDKKNQNNILFLSVHEISHLLLYDILKKNSDKLRGHKMDWVDIYYLKEILASVLINQKALTKYLRPKNYLGNPDLHYLFVLNKNKKIQICKFFQKIYEDMKYKGNKNFIDILKIMIPIILSIKTELQKRHILWNQYGYDVLKQKDIFKEYSKPIIIDPRNISYK